MPPKTNPDTNGYSRTHYSTKTTCNCSQFGNASNYTFRGVKYIKHVGTCLNGTQHINHFYCSKCGTIFDSEQKYITHQQLKANTDQDGKNKSKQKISKQTKT